MRSYAGRGHTASPFLFALESYKTSESQARMSSRPVNACFLQFVLKSSENIRYRSTTICLIERMSQTGMNYQELKISVSTFNGSPLVVVEGKVDEWYAKALEDVLDDILTQGKGAVAIDLTQARFSCIESYSTLIRMLRIASMEARVAVIAGRNTSSMLNMAGLESKIMLCDELEQAAEFVRVKPEYLTSRRMARKSNVEEMPLAA